MKKILIIVLVILVVIGAFFAINNYIYNTKQAYTASDYKDAEYVIEGVRVRLKDGLAEMEEAPGSAGKIVTRYFGNEVRSDLNDDGREDIVFLLTQEPSGSGTFYYVVAALNTERGYVGSEAFLLGDRISPQTTEKGRGKIIVVNYAERTQEDPMTTPPSVGQSIWLLLDPQTMQFGQVEQNFEGEADPKRMSLGIKKWVWIYSIQNDDIEVRPKAVGKFTLTFGTDGKFSATTDCNSMGGSYVAGTSTITFSNIFSTKMFCEGSEESKFASFLEDTESYKFTSKGELVFDLKFDEGAVVFN